jgi:hypothetical protein
MAHVKVIIRTVRIVSIQRLVYITLCDWPSGMQVEKEVPSQPDGQSHRVIYTRRCIDTILILPMMMSPKVLETCRGLKLK